MQTVIAPRGDARTFLTHFVGGGLDDDRYAVQRFHSMANGDIVPIHADGSRAEGPAQGAADDRLAEGGREDAAGARRKSSSPRGSSGAARGSSSGAGGPWGCSRTAGRRADRRALVDVLPAQCRPGVRCLDTSTDMEQPMAYRDPETGRAPRPRAVPAAHRRTPSRRAVPALRREPFRARTQRLPALRREAEQGRSRPRRQAQGRRQTAQGSREGAVLRTGALPPADRRAYRPGALLEVWEGAARA